MPSQDMTSEIYLNTSCLTFNLNWHSTSNLKKVLDICSNYTKTFFLWNFLEQHCCHWRYLWRGENKTLIILLSSQISPKKIRSAETPLRKVWLLLPFTSLFLFLFTYSHNHTPLLFFNYISPKLPVHMHTSCPQVEVVCLGGWEGSGGHSTYYIFYLSYAWPRKVTILYR